MNSYPLCESIPVPRRLARRAGVLLLGAFLLPSAATAQSRFEFTPSLSLAQGYDDNVFVQPNDKREEDFVSRLGGRLGVGVRSRRFSLRARYALDAEAYRDHPELNTPTAYQEGTLNLGWAPSRRTTFSAGASYAEAQASSQLNTVTGVETGRFPSSRVSTAESFSRRFGRLTTATLSHSFTHEQVEGGPESDTQAVVLGIKQRLGPAAEGVLNYSAQRFAFGSDATVSQVVTLGWSRQLTSFTHFEFQAGPRLFEDRTVAAEVSAGLNHRFGRGSAGLAYLRTQTTVIGEPGPVMAEGVTATFSRQLLRSIRLGCGPSIFRVRGVGDETTVRRLSLDVGWRINRHLSLAASHFLTVQRGGFGLAEGPNAEMVHNTLSFSVVAGSGTPN